ncbi:MAG: CerR family C-terminal domain-containing protein [Desulfobacterales bacterium]|nr:CerR family C-terminal domain-containing protein [Desulfobacterales bacterium]
MESNAKTEGSAGAKDRLIEAGIDVFGDHSYEAATTRMIAKKAGVNIAAIPYYFNGKQGLYLSVVEHIVEKLQAFVQPTIEMVGEQTARGDLAPAEAILLVETLLGKMVDFMVGAPEAARFAQIVLREHLHPSSAYEIVYDRVMCPIIDGIAAMIAAATGQPLSDTMKMRALAFMGQVMAFRVARETMVRAVGFAGYSAEETQMIRRVILEQTRGAIESMFRS